MSSCSTTPAQLSEEREDDEGGFSSPVVTKAVSDPPPHNAAKSVEWHQLLAQTSLHSKEQTIVRAMMAISDEFTVLNEKIDSLCTLVGDISTHLSAKDSHIPVRSTTENRACVCV